MSNVETIQKENKMGVMNVNKLLITMSVPMMISMLVQALYNVVDSIFVAMLSEDALTAVSMAFPIQNLMIAASMGTGVGINAMLSKSLGEKNQKQVNASATQGIFLIIIGYVIFLLIGIFGAGIFMRGQTNISNIVGDGTSYVRIICICSFGIFGQVAFERLLQSTGKTFYTMITQGTGAIVNIILDPILIFGLLGMPKMGVAGAAVATVIGQIVAACLAIFFHRKVNHEVKVIWKGFRPDGRVIKGILIVGVPTIIMQAIGSVMTYGMNMILVAFSSTAVAVFGAYFKLQSFVFMPVFGLNNGMIPILAYNYGARNKERMLKTIKLSVMYAVGMMFLGLTAMQLFTTQLLGMFGASEYMLEIGVPALRTISLCFIFAGYSIIISSSFQALGNGIYSMFVSIARQLVVLLPSAYIFSKIGGLSMVWWAFPCAEVVSLCLCTFLMLRINKNVVSKI